MVIKTVAPAIKRRATRASLCVLILITMFYVGYGQPTGKILSIGDQVPDVKVHEWIKGAPISKPIEGNVYVFEFGATWCKPCGMLIPKLSSLSQKYGGRVTVVSFFVMEQHDAQTLTSGEPKYVRRVKNYVQRYGSSIDYTVAVDTEERYMEVNWLKAAGMIGLPYIFLADKNGLIAWIGSDATILESEINRVLAPEYKVSDNILRDSQKQEVFYDPSKLLLIDGNGGRDEDFLFRSILAKYKGDIKTPPPPYVTNYMWAPSGSEYEKYKGRIQATGATLLDLYQLAYGDSLWNQASFRASSGHFPDTLKYVDAKTVYGKSWFEPILEVKNKAPFVWSYKSPENKYNYSLKVPSTKRSAKSMQEAMQRDLKTYFGYDVSIEYRLMPAWRLKATPKARELLMTRTPSEVYRREIDDNGDVYYRNATTRDIITKLATFFGYGMFDHGNMPDGEIGPFIDDTQITYEIDFYLGVSERENFELFGRYLKTVGLYLVKETKSMKVIIIRDAKTM